MRRASSSAAAASAVTKHASKERAAFRHWAVVFTGAASIAVSGAIAAAPIATLFGTGLSSAGVALPAAALDPHYRDLTTGTPAVVVTNTASYFPNNALSEWVWETAAGTPINTTRTFETTFDLTGFNPATAIISGLWGTDNNGLALRLNGVATGITLTGSLTTNFTQLHPFTISSGFMPGLNTLQFDIQDVGSIAAFRVQLSGTAPEPETLALVGLALAGLGFSRRRR